MAVVMSTNRLVQKSFPNTDSVSHTAGAHQGLFYVIRLKALQAFLNDIGPGVRL